MTAHTAVSLKGKLSFMEGQHHARLGVVTTSLRSSSPWVQSRDECQVVIFTDGAVEGEDSGTCTFGGVAFFLSKQPEYFSSHVPEVLVNAWKSQGRKHVILHTELLPVMRHGSSAPLEQRA
eukprot:4521298-Amphidinium_carterae.1